MRPHDMTWPLFVSVLIAILGLGAIFYIVYKYKEAEPEPEHERDAGIAHEKEE